MPDDFTFASDDGPSRSSGSARRRESSFRTGFGLSAGCLLGVAAVCLLACGGFTVGLIALVGIGDSVAPETKATARR